MTGAVRGDTSQEIKGKVEKNVGLMAVLIAVVDHPEPTILLTQRSAHLNDHAGQIAFPGGKTTVYEPGLRLPCVVRNPAAENRGVVSQAIVSWVDIAPTILDFAGVEPPRRVKLHGRSLLPVLEQESPSGWDEMYASHTFHEVTMYYPMRAVRSGRYKLIMEGDHEVIASRERSRTLKDRLML